jgi:hypothetical protein
MTMGRFEPTDQVDPSLEHSVLTLSWGALIGADGPSDGSAGASSNVPSALSVLRHAPLYATHLDEIEDAFAVLRRHPIRYGLLYPVAVSIVPFLFDLVRRRSPLAARIADVIAEYTAAAATLDEYLSDRLFEIVELYAVEVASWVGRYDRAAAALAVHVPAIRSTYLAEVAMTESPCPVTLLALVELGAAPGHTLAKATAMLDHPAADHRMAAAAFLTRFGERTPDLESRIDAALPPWALVALANLVGRLWQVKVVRPIVAPKLHTGEVTYAGEKWVIVRAAGRNVTLPWVGSSVRRGDVVQIGLTAHGQPKLVVKTDADGTVHVVDF